MVISQNQTPVPAAVAQPPIDTPSLHPSLNNNNRPPVSLPGRDPLAVLNPNKRQAASQAAGQQNAAVKQQGAEGVQDSSFKGERVCESWGLGRLEKIRDVTIREKLTDLSASSFPLFTQIS